MTAHTRHIAYPTFATVSQKLAWSHYQLYLPEREQLEAEFHRFLSGQDAQ